MRMMKIVPAEFSKVTKIVCPACGERAARIGLLPNSRIEGLTFKCKKCARLWAVSTE